MENEILKRELLPPKQIEVHGLLYLSFQWTIAYEHYLFLKASCTIGGDCFIIDTKTDSVTNVSTGLGSGVSFISPVHWKDNIFVCYFNYQPSKVYQVALLYVIKNGFQITFETEIININDPQCPQSVQPIQVYQDNLYVIVEGKEVMDLWKYDLKARKWSKCEVTGEIPRARGSSTNALCEGKMYLFGGGISKGTGLFAGIDWINDLSVLDLDKMKWKRSHQDNFLPFKDLSSLRVEVAERDIYIRPFLSPGRVVYNIVTNIVDCNGVDSKDTFSIRTHQNHCILYKEIFKRNTEDALIKYHSFEMTADYLKNPSEATTKTEEDSLEVPHMEMLWNEKPFADITFIVQDEEIQAHRNILLKCRYFRNMFKSGMIEANSNKVNVPTDISATNFKAILEYIYLDRIALTESLALDLIVLADMYLLTKLKADCEDYLSKNLSIGNFLSVKNVAEMAGSERLKDEVMSFLVGNIEKVKEEVELEKIPPEVFVKAILYKKTK